MREEMLYRLNKFFKVHTKWIVFNQPRFQGLSSLPPWERGCAFNLLHV